MNQHRWNCLTALFLSTFIAPISNVRAEVTPPAASSNNNPIPQSLPITPVTLTESQVDAVVPVVQPVPQVSSLPIVTPFGIDRKQTPTTQLKIAKLASFLPTTPSHSPSPVVPVATTAANFSPKLRATTSNATFSKIESSSISPDRRASSTGTVGAVAPLPQLAAKTPATPGPKPFTTQAASAPIYVSRSDNAKLTKALIPPTITNSATVQAEMTVTPIAEDTDSSNGQNTAKTATRILPSAADPAKERAESALVPKVAPLAKYPQDRAEIPSFESGLPVFIFEDDKPPQIVATAIAQVGDEIVAPEPSIAIPVERPKQATVPTQVPVTTPTISKIEPAAITTPSARQNCLDPNGTSFLVWC